MIKYLFLDLDNTILDFSKAESIAMPSSAPICWSMSCFLSWASRARTSSG